MAKMENMANQETQNSRWAETLPSGCPPEAAQSPLGDCYYRLVETFPPTEHDFQSLQKLNPNKSFKESCIARAVSLFNSYEECLGITKLPLYKNHTVVSITLLGDSGVILQTGSKRRSHFSWWRLKDFNPIPCCQKI